MTTLFNQPGIYERFEWDAPEVSLNNALERAKATVRDNMDLAPQFLEITYDIYKDYAASAQPDLTYTPIALLAKAYELAFANDPNLTIEAVKNDEGWISLWAVNQSDETCLKIGLVMRRAEALSTIWRVIRVLREENPYIADDGKPYNDYGLSNVVTTLKEIALDLEKTAEPEEREFLSLLKEGIEKPQARRRGRQPNPSEIYRKGVSKREVSRKEWAETFAAIREEWRSTVLN